ncbi:TPA: extracellular solute-binding protein [Streptococcus pneumoniae]|nr:extracellular solute-binding protein [Streptococcus pneumoniae]HEW5508949.1 extracellular solute-binding protein [Streptococcus pneumoniae]
MVKLNKVLKGSVAFLSASLLLAACGNNANSKPAEKTADGKTKISFLSTWQINDVRPPKDETLVGQWLEEQLGIDIDLVTIPGEGVSSKVNSLITSNQLPTVLLTTGDKSDIAGINKLGKQGAFLDLSQHMDKLPNYKKYLEKNNALAQIEDDEKHIYAFTKFFTDENIMYTTPILRKDLLVGSEFEDLSKIKTVDDYTKVLKYLTEKQGSPAFIQRNGYEGFMKRVTPLWNLSHRTYYDYESDSYKHPVEQPQLKQFVEWLKELRKDNVLHPDWAVMKDETWEGLLASNKGSFTVDRMNIIGDNNFDKSFDWQPLVYPKINGKRYLQPKTPYISDSGWVINANAPKEEIDKALEFFNFLYADENQEKLAIGFEGKTFTRENPNTQAGIKWLIQIYGENAGNDKAELLFKHGNQAFTRVQTKLDIEAQPGTFPKVMYDQVDKIKKDLGGFRPDTPVLSFKTEELDVLTKSEAGLNTFFDENIIKFIEGQRDMSEWDSFINEAKSKDLDKVTKVYNDAYKRVKDRMK